MSNSPPGLIITTVAIFLSINTSVVENAQQKFKLGYSATRHADSFKIDNFEPFLDFFGHCLIHVINYKGNDLYSAMSPVVLSRYDVVKVTILKEEPTTWFLLTRRIKKVVMRKVPFEKATLLNHTLAEPCKRDFLLYDCMVRNVDIPHLDLVTKVRPWRCEAHFYLFPPSLEQDKIFYEEIIVGKAMLRIPAGYRRFWRESDTFRNSINGTFEPTYVANTRERYEVLALQVGSMRISDVRKVMIAWSRAVLQIFDMFGLQDVFITSRRELLVSFAIPAVVRDKLSPKIISMTGDVVMLCRYCKRCNPLKPVNIGKLEKLTQSLAVLNADTSNMVVRAIVPYSMFVVVYNHSFDFPASMMTNREFHHLLKWAPTLNNVRDEMTLRYLKAIHGNVTFHPRIHTCFMGLRTSKSHQPGCGCHDHADFYPHIVLAYSGDTRYSEIDFQKTDLLFVSCETPMNTRVDLTNLINVFDTWTWLLILFCLLIIPLIVMWLLRIEFGKCSISILTSNNFMASCLVVFKALVEQPDPVTQTKLLNIRSYRTLLIPVIMMGVIVSTGYKNENITRITLPTETLPFDNFSTLVEHNFTILTRVTQSNSGSPDGNQWVDIIYRVLYELGVRHANPNLKFVNQHEVGYGLITELYDFVKIQNSFSEQYYIFSTIANQSVSPATQYLLDNTKVDPNWLETRAHIISQESVLHECNKIALLLPAIEAREMYHNVQDREGFTKKKSVFLGNPAHPLLSIGLGLRFLHWTSPLILQRVKGLKQSGIIEWLEDYAVKFMTQIRTPRNILRDELERKAFRPSDTNGNIVVVFVPFGVGLAISFIVYALLDCNWKMLFVEMQEVGRSFSLAYIIWANTSEVLKSTRSMRSKMDSFIKRLPGILKGSLCCSQNDVVTH